MNTEKKIDNRQGHWILANLGKKVLRPGGREATRILLEKLQIGEGDDVIEFAPGLGLTAEITKGKHPHSYTAVERNEQAAEIVREKVAPSTSILQSDCTFCAAASSGDCRKKKSDTIVRIVNAPAQMTGLPSGCATKVYGEAMLTMQGKAVKRQIIAEAARLLRPGGLYGIHEIELIPEDIADDRRNEIYHSLQDSINSTVSPLTEKEWASLMEEAGLEVVSTFHNGMKLLEPSRMIADEGFFGFLKIASKALLNPKARSSVRKMRNTLRKYSDSLGGMVMVARKK